MPTSFVGCFQAGEKGILILEPIVRRMPKNDESAEDGASDSERRSQFRSIQAKLRTNWTSRKRYDAHRMLPTDMLNRGRICVTHNRRVKRLVLLPQREGASLGPGAAMSALVGEWIRRNAFAGCAGGASSFIQIRSSYRTKSKRLLRNKYMRAL
jgi:hypothetical protein